MSVKRLLYSSFLYLISPLVLLRLLWRSRLNPAYRHRISERFGFVTIDQKRPVIWVHAVSVGETIAAKPFIEGLIAEYPKYQILVTTTTPTGSDRVKALFSNRVAHVYFPYDLPDAVTRFLKRVSPQLVIIVETEIWPNLYSKCNKLNIPLMMVNARLSKRSMNSYLKIRGLVAETLVQVNRIAVRSESDAQHFQQLGANDNQLERVGNIKYDLQLDETRIKQGQQWRRQWGKDKPVWVAASTHDGEDQIILRIYQQLIVTFPELMLVLVPRHPERFDVVYEQCKAFKNQLGNTVPSVRHSQIDDYTDLSAKIVVGDSMGEMQSWYACADIIFIGGSLVDTGGHNPLEGTALAVPVVSGPSMFNFEDVVNELADTDLLTVCDNQNDLVIALTNLLRPSTAIDYKGQAQNVMQQHRGVTARLLQLVSKLL